MRLLGYAGGRLSEESGEEWKGRADKGVERTKENEIRIASEWEIQKSSGIRGKKEKDRS